MTPKFNAFRLAWDLHAGQVDKVGRPYMDHLLAVTIILRRRWPDAPEYPLEAAFYADWIRDLATHGSLWSIRIKLADNEHNSDPARAVPGSDLVERRYAPARRVLEAGLAERFSEGTGN